MPALSAVTVTVVDVPAASVTGPVAAAPVRVSHGRSPSPVRSCSLIRTSSGAEPLLVTFTSAVAFWPWSSSQSRSPPVTVAMPVVNAVSLTSA